MCSGVYRMHRKQPGALRSESETEDIHLHIFLCLIVSKNQSADTSLICFSVEEGQMQISRVFDSCSLAFWEDVRKAKSVR
jgi:hypothetical protein